MDADELAALAEVTAGDFVRKIDSGLEIDGRIATRQSLLEALEQWRETAPALYAQLAQGIFQRANADAPVVLHAGELPALQRAFAAALLRRLRS